MLLRARAIENQVYVFAPAQFGAHGAQRRSYGHALIVDPWGAVIAECGDHEGFALARLGLRLPGPGARRPALPQPPPALS